MSTDDEQSTVTPAVARRVAGAAGIGNFMEWFDFAVYGFFAVTIGKVFFPSDNETASLLLSLAVYGVAFLVRPIGGLVLGAFADRHGRRAALSLTVVLMGISTTLVAALPTYASVGLPRPRPAHPAALRAGLLGRWRVDRHVRVPRRVRAEEPPRAVGQRRLDDRCAVARSAVQPSRLRSPPG